MNLHHIKQSAFCFIASSAFVGIVCLFNFIGQAAAENPVIVAHVSKFSFFQNRLYYGDTIVMVEPGISALHVLLDKEEIELRRDGSNYTLCNGDNKYRIITNVR